MHQPFSVRLARVAAFVAIVLWFSWLPALHHAEARYVPGWGHAEQAAASTSVTPAIPRLKEVVRRGNCSGPPSPGEQVVLAASVGYRIANRVTLQWGLRLEDANGRAATWVKASQPSHTRTVTGRGRLERSYRFVLQDTVRPLTGPVRAATWGRVGARSAIRSAALQFRLGTTLAVRAVDAEGRGVDAAATVTSGGCLRSRGATWQDAGGQRAVFFHLDPAEPAEVFLTAQGFLPLRRTFTSLPGGRTKALTLQMARGVDMAALRAKVEPLVNSWGGQNAVTITDLQTGQSLSVNGDRAQPAACTIKIFIMFAIAQDIAAGRYSKESVASLVYSAMGPSATPPARELIRIAGGGDVGAGINRIHEIMSGLGMSASVMRHAPGYPWEVHDLGPGDNLLTTDELNLALGKLYRGQALEAEEREYVLWSMTLATPFLNGSLGGPLPDEATLYHKIGLIGPSYNTWNDAGIVTFERGGKRFAYAISYLGSFGARYRDAYWRGYQLSDLAWQAFSGRYTGE